MKNMKKSLAATLILCLILTLFSGCGNLFPRDDDGVPTDLCVVIGAHQNFPAFDLITLYDSVYRTCRTPGGSISAVVVDGNGQVLFDKVIPAFEKGIDNEKRCDIAKENAGDHLYSLFAAAAQTPEVDTLRALTLGRNLLAARNSPKKELVIVDSGLSTTGLLDFTSSSLIEQAPEMIVSQLRELHALPDLSGIDVTVYGLGQTCGAQTCLTPDYAYKLEQIWTAILNAGQCRSLEISPAPLGSAGSRDSLPGVSCVPVISDSLTFAAPAASDAIPDVIRFDETRLSFLRDSAQLMDPDKASEAVTPVAEVLRSQPENQILLAGMTASAGGDGLELSRARAETVKALLVEKGVREEQISCLGLGSRNNCLRTPDLDSEGQLIENQARRNRAVFLLLQDGPTAQGLLSQVQGEVL